VHDVEKPRPRPTPTTKPFWDALARDRVEIQRCDDCRAWIHYPRVRCPQCFSPALAFETVPGTGTLHTFTISRQATSPHFVDDVPQILAIVELDGCPGVKLTTTLTGTDGSDLAVGQPVEPVFEHGDDGVTLLRYRPPSATR
jgi:uncharacterized OB-fold protein